MCFQIQNVVAYTTGLKNLVFFNDVHSYSQLVLTPWGWTIQKCPGKDDMDAVFQRVSILYTAGLSLRRQVLLCSFEQVERACLCSSWLQYQPISPGGTSQPIIF